MVPSQSMQYIQFQRSKVRFSDADTIVETPFSQTVKGKNWLTFMCTPISLEEMATGLLFNEGVIDKWEEVSEVRVCERGDKVDIWLNHEAPPLTSWQ